MPQPNDLDKKRIERALKARKRYRYVKPAVLPVDGGYLISSPCCSRNIDPEGGVVDVARLEFEDATSLWQLYRKNHVQQTWELCSQHARLHEALEHLNADPDRKFWQ